MRIRKAMATARRCGLLATGAAVVGIVGIVGSVGVVGVAHSEVDGAVALGGGQRGEHSYASVEGRLDARWASRTTSLRLGLAVRGQWDDGRWRRDDFTTAAGLGQLVRYLEIWQGSESADPAMPGEELALALGGLRPAALGNVSDGAQVGVDDRYHTGLRGRLRQGALELRGELDDVFAPELFGAEAAWLTPSWRFAAAGALGWAAWGDDLFDEALEHVVLGDDGAPPSSPMLPAAPVDSALELSVARRLVREGGEGRLGLGLVGEPGQGVHAVLFASVDATTYGWHLALRGDARAGSGTLGAAFGPLYRVERLQARIDEARRDLRGNPSGDPSDGDAAEMQGRGAGFSGAVALRLEHASYGWFEGGLRARHRGGAVASLHAGAPITAHAQAGAWLAADEERALLAGEARFFWRAGSFAAVEVSRLLRERAPSSAVLAPDEVVDAAAPRLGWAVIGWIGIGR